MNKRFVREQLDRELDALWRFAWRLTKNADEAADLVQQTCVRALEKEHLYQHQGKFKSWLFRIEHNLWKNTIRTKITARVQDEAAGNQTHRYPGENEAEDSVYLQQVYRAVEALPDEQRVPLQLVCVEGNSYAEVAQILDVPIGTVMSRIARARIRLGEQFRHEQKERQEK